MPEWLAVTDAAVAWRRLDTGVSAVTWPRVELNSAAKPPTIGTEAVNAVRVNEALAADAGRA